MSNPPLTMGLKSLMMMMVERIELLQARIVDLNVSMDRTDASIVALAAQDAAQAASAAQPEAVGVPWFFVTTGTGLLTTTTTEIAQAPAGKRCRVTSLQASVGGLTGTTVEILAGTTVLWRGFVPPNAPLNAFFGTPLRSDVAGKLSLKLGASLAIGMQISVQGYVA